jgi:hypothetical protein
MVASMLDETRLTLTELSKLEGVHSSTIWSWHRRGVRGVKLETFFSGGRRFTTTAAVRRFQERVTAAAANGEQADCDRAAKSGKAVACNA